MPLPELANTGIVEGTFVVAPTGGADSGTLTFDHYPEHVSVDGVTISVPTSQVTLDGDGKFTVELLATDDSDVNPQGRVYRVRFNLASGSRRSVWMAVLAGQTSLFEDVVVQSAPPLINVIRGPAGVANVEIVPTPPAPEMMLPGRWYVVAP